MITKQSPDSLISCFPRKPVKGHQLGKQPVTSRQQNSRNLKGSEPLTIWTPPPTQRKLEHLDDADIYFCLLGKSHALQILNSLPHLPPTLSTIKLKYVSFPWSSLSGLEFTPGLQFLQLDKVKVSGPLITHSKICLAQLKEFYFNEIKSSNSFHSSLEYLKELDWDWERLLFFRNNFENSIQSPGWNLPSLFRSQVNLDLQIAGRHLLVVNYVQRKFVLHCSDLTTFSEVFDYFCPKEGQVRQNLPFESVLLSNVDFKLCPTSRFHLGGVTHLNLNRVGSASLDENQLSKGLALFPNLKRLFVTESPQLRVDISCISPSVKSLSLNVGMISCSGKVDQNSSPLLNLDSLTIYESGVDPKVLQGFNRIFKCGRVGLGGDLSVDKNSSNTSVLDLIRTLLTTQYDVLDWFFIWRINFLGWKEGKDVLNILGVSELSAICEGGPGWVFEFDVNSQQLVGRVVGEKEGHEYVQDLLGFTDFYEPI